MRSAEPDESVAQTIYNQNFQPFFIFLIQWTMNTATGVDWRPMTSLVVLEAWPWPRGSLRTPDEGLGLGLGLGLGKTFFQDPGHVVCVCSSAHTHGVT